MANTTRIIEQMVTSPYPPSFQGSGWLYAVAVFSLLLISAVGAGTIILAGKNSTDQVRWTHSWWTHLAFLLAACGATIRCATEAAYKMAWGQTSTSTLETLLTIKNVGDAMVFIPVLSWMAIYRFSVNRVDRNRAGTVRFFLIVSIIAAISAICAFTKV